ncbi:ATP-binding cassette domain-containing protein [Endozoicomonas sp. G2_1]|uniref:ABC transporter ATP-binding protein n=1 Tax=Endozoicomonas sp. G2_1 TaxID=2821091 RepID=UPI001ADB28D6|nr:ATP-binding cassette domain-containing protein [Endozoicomonas sp. G2_1]MBO9490216.1 ATP-binding cassette domain-containing protein [Endozoicomonas sp. G2_1]
MLSLSNLSKSYQHQLLFNQLNIDFGNSKYCIRGVNGSGKTTLLMLAGGLEPADQGTVTIDNIDIRAANAKRLIGVCSDKIQLPSFLTSQQLLEFHLEQHQCQWPQQMIEQLSFGQQLATGVAKLSLGSYKKLGLLLALSHQPKYLLLDEPTTGLDQASRDWLISYLDSSQQTLVLASHEACFTEHKDYQQLDIANLKSSNE